MMMIINNSWNTNSKTQCTRHTCSALPALRSPAQVTPTSTTTKHTHTRTRNEVPRQLPKKNSPIAGEQPYLSHARALHYITPRAPPLPSPHARTGVPFVIGIGKNLNPKP